MKSPLYYYRPESLSEANVLYEHLDDQVSKDKLSFTRLLLSIIIISQNILTNANELKEITKCIKEKGKEVFNQKLIYYDLKRYSID